MSDYKIKENSYSNLNKNKKIVFISAEFNRTYTEALENINEKLLNEKWFNNISKFLVPWAYEIPGFLKKIIKQIKPDLIICFWVVIRWATTHYEMVAWESARWIMNISLKTNTAIINGILTCENENQVRERISNTYAISWLNLVNEVNKLWLK